MKEPKIKSVQAADYYKIILDYTNGETKVFDVSPYISGPWFEELNDIDYFRTVDITVDGCGISWPHGQDIAPHELYDLSTRIN